MLYNYVIITCDLFKYMNMIFTDTLIIIPTFAYYPLSMCRALYM